MNDLLTKYILKLYYICHFTNKPITIYNTVSDDSVSIIKGFISTISPFL